MKTKQTDKRPDPKPRKHPQLWQSYLWWHELVEMRKRHMLRISSIERGKSNLDAMFEYDMMDALALDETIDLMKDTMINYGQAVGSIWNQLTSIKGLGAGSLAAQLLSQIDDIAKFDTISKLWRYCGYAVIDGQAERNKKGEKSKFNRQLKGVCWNVGDQFIKQQTPGYVDIYYDTKRKQRERFPEKVKQNGHYVYTDGHIHNRAFRKMIKIFLQHLWLQWRMLDGLPVSKPYVESNLGHHHIITPNNCGWVEIAKDHNVVMGKKNAMA